MEALENIYSELATTEMKYDHLFNVCTNLLKTWPLRDSTGKVIRTEQKASTEGEVVNEDSKSTTEVEVVDKALEEMQLLDAILQKAENVRTPPQHKPKCASLPSDKPKSSSLSSRSSQQAAKVYKQPTIIKTQKSAGRANSTLKSCSRVAVITRQRKKSAPSAKVIAGSVKKLPSTFKPIGGSNRCSNKGQPSSSKDIDRRACSGHAPVSREPEREVESDSKDSFAFDIKQHGGKLALPSRYHKLQEAVCKLSEEVHQRATLTAGQRFCKRLSSRSELGSLQVLRNTLLAEELTWLKKRLLSLTPQELTVNERSSWEEVWKIKTTLEAVTEHAQNIRDAHSMETTTPSLKEDAREQPVAHSNSAPGAFAYSSLEEWQSMATAELQLMLYRHELELVAFINQKLLPLLPVADCPTHVIQTVYELAGISKPIYIKLSDNES